MKENIIALHQKNIAKGAEHLFLDKGFNLTSISDISETSGYSRRTIYKYFESKEEILYYLIIEGLDHLVQSIGDAIDSEQNFLKRYEAICACMLFYYENYAISAQSVNRFQSNAPLNMTTSVERIFALGVKINEYLSIWIEQGKEEGILKESLDVMPTVYILSTNLNALFELVTTKGTYLFASLHMTKEQFLSYGYTMNLNSLLKEPTK
ncbi:TetR/AcrR family transcriptional regulator [Bacillus testis]|uniref:TetR/AcrR family transcriptional regulator n=1 Tax=Bacillus testis TaxID=1622072 RepID=UPI00067E80C6|nr:TetR/AcrR family transcriptional regulator [Bacillus testis]